MREFLLETLEGLKTLTGLNQFENLLLADDSEKAISTLLDELERTCNKFGYLSEETKKNIISKNIFSDQSFKGLHPAKVYQWLSAYWTALTPAQIQALTNPEKKKEKHEPLSPEDAQKYIDSWKKVHAQIAEPMTKTAKVKVNLSDGRRQNELKQEVINCPRCENDPLCGYCNGLGKVKKTIL
jgi:hypothetical protein